MKWHAQDPSIGSGGFRSRVGSFVLSYILFVYYTPLALSVISDVKPTKVSHHV